MDPDVSGAILDLLTARKVLCLATTIDGEPAASLLPFAMAPDFLAVYVQASSLARHSRGLQAGGQVSVLIHGPRSEQGQTTWVAGGAEPRAQSRRWWWRSMKPSAKSYFRSIARLAS
jgi:hypothetical protein